MLFLLGKVVGWLLFPSTLALFVAIVGTLVARFASRRPRLARVGGIATLAGLGFLAVAMLTPLGVELARPLEARFPLPAADAPPPEGIILLGGGIDSVAEMRTGRVAYHVGAEALAEALALAKRFPNVPVMTTGDGPIGTDGTDYSSAASMGRLLVAAGVAADRIVPLRRARTTWEEATLSHEMLSPRPGARWYLVTPAWHMPRSIGAFRAAGWDGIVAWPSAGRVGAHRSLNTAPSVHLMLVDLAAREWTGMALYRLLGRSPALFPAP